MAIRSLARRAFPVLLSLGGVAGVVPLAAGAQAAPAGFLDPERVQKLSSAFPDIDRIFREFTEREHVPGAIWGIVIDGALAHVGTTGFRDLETQAPVEPTTVFRIASMTKSFTAAAILALRDQGRLSLDDPA
ncbi:MAG: beta-lactamase family protein, partial [Gemmatimonadetes bacterium]|nr:beta-lactamase family protein [Gemmatimonadota bacterium]